MVALLLSCAWAEQGRWRGEKVNMIGPDDDILHNVLD